MFTKFLKREDHQSEAINAQDMVDQVKTLTLQLKNSEQDLRAARKSNQVYDTFLRTIFRYGSTIRPVVVSQEQLDYMADAPGFYVGEDGTVAYGDTRGTFLFGTPTMIRNMSLRKAVN